MSPSSGLHSVASLCQTDLHDPKSEEILTNNEGQQITSICKEHGQLMADIWLGNAAMIEMIIERLRDFSFECRTR